MLDNSRCHQYHDNRRKKREREREEGKGKE
jgi:hypothetical protein